MSINPGGTANYNWNYSKQDKPGYSTSLTGTVLAIQEVQKMGYTMGGQPGAPEFWPDGNPKMNIRIALATATGELKTFVFQPAGKDARAGRKKSVHMDLFHLTGDTDMLNLIGKTIRISTQEGYYGQGHPRPWRVELVNEGPYTLSGPLPPEFKAAQVLANSAVSGGQLNAPQPMQQPQPYQPQPQQYQPYQQPQQYQPSQSQPQYQPQYQQQPAPQPYQPQYQPQPTPPQMDPEVMAAMKQMGVTSYEVIPPAGSDQVGSGQVYDDDLPY